MFKAQKAWNILKKHKPWPIFTFSLFFLCLDQLPLQHFHIFFVISGSQRVLTTQACQKGHWCSPLFWTLIVTFLKRCYCIFFSFNFPHHCSLVVKLLVPLHGRLLDRHSGKHTLVLSYITTQCVPGGSPYRGNCFCGEQCIVVKELSRGTVG